MKAKYITIFFSITVIISVTLGCVNRRMNLVDRGLISVEIVKNEEVEVYGVKILRDDENIVVSGTVKSNNNAKSPVRGHVEVTLIGLTGEILMKVSTACQSRRHPRVKAWNSYFKVNIPIIPPQGARVCIDYFNGLGLRCC